MLKLFASLLLVPTFVFSLSLVDSRHLMGRTSFSLSKDAFKILKDKNREDAVSWLLNSNEKSDILPVPEILSKPLIRNKKFKNMSVQERKEFNKKRKMRVIALKEWWMQSMIETKTPLREKMTLFWHNHFTSGIRKVKSSYLMLKQNEILRQNALGNFKTFLHEISKDPAMILYLDNQSNKKKKANENYAREVMELFTLGVGHYSEKDIGESARAYTGWHVNRKTGKFINIKKFHDDKTKVFLGQSGHFNGDDVLDIILEQKRTAEFITEKFYKEFINNVDVNKNTIEKIATDFYDSGYEIKILLKDILLSDDFWAKNNRGVLVKSPVELLVGTLRLFDIKPKKVRGIVIGSKQLKQDIFSPPNVKGWDGGNAWLDSNSVIVRNQIISRFVRGKEGSNGKTMMMKKSNNFFKNKKFSKDEKIDFLKGYLLAIEPIENVDYSRDLTSITQDLVLDPVYQLK